MATASAQPDRSTGSTRAGKRGGTEGAGRFRGGEGAMRAAPSLRKSISSTGVGEVNSWCSSRPRSW